jgi:hypothetical protein
MSKRSSRQCKSEPSHPCRQRRTLRRQRPSPNQPSKPRQNQPKRPLLPTSRARQKPHPLHKQSPSTRRTCNQPRHQLGQCPSLPEAPTQQQRQQKSPRMPPRTPGKSHGFSSCHLPPMIQALKTPIQTRHPRAGHGPTGSCPSLTAKKG